MAMLVWNSRLRGRGLPASSRAGRMSNTASREATSIVMLALLKCRPGQILRTPHKPFSEPGGATKHEESSPPPIAEVGRRGAEHVRIDLAVL